MRVRSNIPTFSPASSSVSLSTFYYLEEQTFIIWIPLSFHPSGSLHRWDCILSWSIIPSFIIRESFNPRLQLTISNWPGWISVRTFFSTRNLQGMATLAPSPARRPLGVLGPASLRKLMNTKNVQNNGTHHEPSSQPIISPRTLELTWKPSIHTNTQHQVGSVETI